MKKEILYRLIEEVIKESEEPIIDEELKNLLDILQYDYNMFAEVAPYTIAEDTPLGQKHGVTKVKAGDVFDARIYFESDEAMESFVRILESVGLRGFYPSTEPIEYHFTAKKQRQSKNPKVYAYMGPRVIFKSPDDEE